MIGNGNLWGLKMILNVNDRFSKEDIVAMVDAAGALHFDNWYKNTLEYKNSEFVVSLIPDYRDTCTAIESLRELLLLEDYVSVTVLKGTGKPFEWEWYKSGDEG